MEVESILLLSLSLFCPNMASSINSLVHTHPNKMALLKENTGTSLKPQSLFYLKLLCLLPFGHALLTATFLINLLPTFVLNFVSPWSKLYSASPDLSQLKVFGCACYPHLRPYSSHKLDHRTKECIFIGYSTSSKGYLCLDPSSHHLCTSRHVLFNETKFPSSTPLSPLSQSSTPVFDISNSLWLSNLLYLHASNQPSLLGPYNPLTAPPSSAPLNSNTIDVLLS